MPESECYLKFCSPRFFFFAYWLSCLNTRKMCWLWDRCIFTLSNDHLPIWTSVSSSGRWRHTDAVLSTMLLCRFHGWWYCHLKENFYVKNWLLLELVDLRGLGRILWDHCLPFLQNNPWICMIELFGVGISLLHSGDGSNSGKVVLASMNKSKNLRSSL